MRCFSYTPHASFSEMFLLHCSSNDYTEIIPDVIHCPNKDARARSDRLQLGTAHIQSFTQTRQVSVVMGMTWVWGCYRLLASAEHAQGAAATDTPRLASSRYRLTRQLSPDMTSSVHLSFFLHSSCCLVRSFSYTPRDDFSEEFLLHSSSWF